MANRTGSPRLRNSEAAGVRARGRPAFLRGRNTSASAWLGGIADVDNSNKIVASRASTGQLHAARICPGDHQSRMRTATMTTTARQRAAPLAERVAKAPWRLSWLKQRLTTFAAGGIPVTGWRWPASREPCRAPAGPSVARVDVARRLTEAIWDMLTSHQPFAPEGATPPILAA